LALLTPSARRAVLIGNSDGVPAASHMLQPVQSDGNERSRAFRIRV
jgi:hypothetical protein